MNDDLIEKAAKAIYDARFAENRALGFEITWEDEVRGIQDGWREQARVALAVFEEAHAPTDDCQAVINEDTDSAWQAIADALGRYGFDLNSHEDTAEWVRQYLFRRPVSPEPITEEQINAERARQIEKGHTPEHDRQHGIAHVLRYVLHYGSRGEHLKAYAMVEAALEIAPPMSQNDDEQYAPNVG